MEPFSPFTGGASLLLSFRVQKKTVLVIGGDALAASRAYVSLEADANVVVLVRGGLQAVCDELQWRARQGQVSVLDWDTLLSDSCMGQLEADLDLEQDITALDAYLAKTPSISLVCVTGTLSPSFSSRTRIPRHRILLEYVEPTVYPFNVADMPALCDFYFASYASLLRMQLGVTANGEGCRLVSRIRREACCMPYQRNLEVRSCAVGQLRRLAREQERKAEGSDAVDEKNDVDLDTEGENGDAEDTSVNTPNQPVPIRRADEPESVAEAVRRRMRWVAQVSEYWPISRLSALTEPEMRADGTTIATRIGNPFHPISSKKEGRILLVGSGPGHPSLLTLATHNALTKHADLVLSDKLKLPRRGLTVVRVPKTRGSSCIWSRRRGAPCQYRAYLRRFAAPTFAGIPVTQRGVAETFVVCTGVGRQGKEVRLPGYERSRTLLILMGVGALLGYSAFSTTSEEEMARPIPPTTPIAIIERGSMPDQRVLVSTLADVCTALESLGAQRPPGMIVVGWAVLALHGHGDVRVLEEGEGGDEERVKRWLEGISEGWAAM
ncbi:uroporphyrin-III C-methyltransferase [Pisolithus tinctorius]|nr:uroporphyrin-III C-methyltransferase [Pisolithus tinctorius]